MADGTLKVGTITTSSGSGTITLGQSGETISIGSGVTNNVGFVNYGASAYMSGTQVIGTGAATKVSLNAEYYDENSEFDTSTNRYTASETGKYYIFGGVGENGETGANVIWAPYIYKNGSELIRGSQTTDYAVSYWFPVGGLITTLNATDYIELYVFHNKGSNATINGDNNTILTILRIA